ncbi:MAG: hypothetical protein Ct9H300mP15_19370 [Gemmatimonadota bacterium]|nr:MAG: hypothetical protein Ct9H300mP15_19370 [Gemmatimonadota bacterium]
MTSNPASMMESTMPGQRESIQFTVDQAGNYSMVCYIAGHALTGCGLLQRIGRWLGGSTAVGSLAGFFVVSPPKKASL